MSAPRRPDEPGRGVLTDAREGVSGAPPPDTDAERGVGPVDESVDGGADPEVGVETREISLGELREAAARAGWVTYDGRPIEVHVDLVDAEEREDVEGRGDPERCGVEPPERPRPDAAAVDPPSTDAPPRDPPPPVAAVPGPFGAPAVLPEPDEPEHLAGAGAGGPGVETGEEPDGEAADLDGAIDPRIRERRVAVSVEVGRKRRRVALVAIALASLVGIAWLVVQAPFLSVQSVQVQGATAETRVAVQRAAAVEDGTPLLFLDTGEVERRVEALPWVADAEVSRDLPTGVTITVEERLPVAWARRGGPPSPAIPTGPVAVVDVTGRVLGNEAAPPPGLPEIIGLAAIPARGAHVSPRAAGAALAALPDALAVQTAALEVRRGTGVLKLGTPPGGAPPAAGEVRLGKLEQVAQKGAAAIAVLDQLVAGGETVRYVDVRVPGAPATR